MSLLPEELSEEGQKRMGIALRCVGFFCATIAAVQLVEMDGWGIDFFTRTTHFIATFSIIAIFAIHEILRFRYFVDSFLKYARHFWFETLLVCATPIVIFFMFWTGAHTDSARSEHFLSIINFLLIAIMALRALRLRSELAAGKSLSPGMVFILSFAILIALGTIMLITPRASVEGLSFVNALFFSTSAVCVTGLVPVESMPATLTNFGQIIIMILSQLGGLGVMSITYFFAYFFAGGLTIKNRFAFQDLFSENNISQIGTVLGLIVGFTAAVEAVGAVWIYFAYACTAPELSDPVFFSIFHSIMAFCNAGFSTMPGGLSGGGIPNCNSLLCAIVLMTLIGGIGFPVLKNFWLVILYKLRRRFIRGYDSIPVRLSVHSKLVLWTTAIIIVGGIIAVYISGLHSEHEIGTARTLFLAASSRTSGFDIGNTSDLSSGTHIVMMFLMFIGGAPFSTAGGIKLTTLAVAFLSLKQYIFGRRDLELFGRRLDSDVANHALAIALLGAVFFSVVALILCVLHPEINGMSLLFEAVSACGTVGLSCGVTPHLSDAAKCLLVFAMFVGRIGVLFFVASFVVRRAPTGARLPETTITLS